MEDEIAGLTKNKIFQLLSNSNYNAKEMKKLEKRKGQTFREDLAELFVNHVRSRILDSRS